MPRYLTGSENGVLKLLVSYSLIFSQLGTLGIPIALNRFFPYFRNKSNKNAGIFLILFLIGLIGFALFIIIYSLINESIYQNEIEKSPLFAQFLYLIIPLTFFFIYFNILDTYARSLLFSTVGAFLKELVQRLLILAVLLVYIAGIIDFREFLFLYISALSISTAILFFFLLRKGEIGVVIDKSKFNSKIIIQIVSLSGFGLFLGMSQMAISNIDIIMINHFLNDAKTGIYAITFYYGTLVIMPSRALYRIVNPVIAEAFKLNDLETIRNIQKKTCLNQFIIGLGIFLVLWVNIDNVHKILPSEFSEGQYVIFFIGLANLIHMAGGAGSQIINNSEKYRFNGFFVIVYLILLVVTNIIMIPKYGISGAAIASMLSVLIFNILKYLLLFNKYNIQPYNYRYLIILGFGIVCYTGIYYLPMPEALIPNIFIKSSLFGLCYLIFIFMTGYSEDINHLINSFKNKLFK